ncbi:MAG: hypothetical protein V1876_02980 [Candidatus Peregrinibacteria bacterium]
MPKPMKNPDQPKENPADRPQEQRTSSTPEALREREVVVERVTVTEDTRKQLEELARRLPHIEGTRQERFKA